MAGFVKVIVGALEVVAGVILLPVNPFAGASLIVSGLATEIGGFSQILGGRPKLSNQQDGIKSNVRGTSQAHGLVFGQARVGGVIIYLNTAGQSNTTLHIGIAHSASHAGGCEKIGRIWMDQQEIAVGQIATTTITDNAGKSVARYTIPDGNGSPFSGLVFANFYRGTALQGADTELTTLNICRSTDYARGICWTHFALYRNLSNDAQFQKAFGGRIPTISVELYGLRLYDPRLDSTAGGSGTQRVNDPTTWTYSDNPALACATYMVMLDSDGGMNVSPTEIDWFSVAAAANICDQSDGNGGKLYRVSAVLSTDANRNENLTALIDSMAGTVVKVGATYRIFAGAWRTVSFAIDDTWLAGAPQITTKQDLSKIYNAVRISSLDRTNGYSNMELPSFTSSAFEAQDGGVRIYRDANFPTVADTGQAQRLGQLMGLKSRRGKSVVLPCNYKGLNVEVWETGTVTLPGYGFNGATFRITNVLITEAGPVLTLTEDASTDYVSSGVTTIAAAPAGSISYAVPPAPTNLVAYSIADGVHLSWTQVPAYQYDVVYIYRRTAAYTSGGTSVPAGAFAFYDQTYGQSWRDVGIVGTSYDYYITTRTAFGVESPNSVTVNGAGKIVANGADVTATAGFVLLQNPSFESGNNGWDFQTGWSIAADSANARTGTYVGVYNGTGNAAIVNMQRIPCQPGDVIQASCWMKSASGAGGTGQVRIDYYSGFNSGYLGSSVGNAIAPSTAYQLTRIVAPVIAGANYARIDAAVYGTVTGPWYADDFVCSIQPRSQDEVPDGTIYGRRTNRTTFDMIQNGDFEASNTLPPPGWANGPTGLVANDYSPLAVASLQYATGADVYTGGQSLVLNCSGQYQGVNQRTAYRVFPGEVYNLTAAIKTSGIGARLYMRYYNAAGSWLNGAGGAVDAAFSTTSSTYSLIGGQFTVPNGAVTGIVCIDNGTNASGAIFVDLVSLRKIASLDGDVMDGTTYGRVNQNALTGGQPDFSRPGILNRNLDNVSDTANFSRVYTSRVNVGRPFIDFGEGIHYNKNLDYISDTATYSRIFAGRVNAGRPTIDFSEAIHANKNLGYIPDSTGRSARIVYPFNDNGASTSWQWVGTVSFGGIPRTATLDIHCGVGYNTNGNQQSTTRLVIRSANNTSAPNLSGLTYYTQGTQTIQGVKARANGGNTSAGNAVWDIFVLQTGFSGGTYTVDLQPGDTWTPVGNFPGDPGASSSTLVVGYGNAIVDELARFDFNRGLVLNRNLDNVSDTANYSRIFTGRVNAGRPTIDFSEGIHGNKSLDFIADTGSFARVAANHVISGVPALSVAGSGVRLGDQRNAPAILIANQRSKWLGMMISSSYSSASPAIVTISTSAATLQMGNASVSYAAMSAQVSQDRSGVPVTYFLYCDDTSFAGGGRTLVITTSGDSLYQADGRIYIGSVSVTVPATGTGAGGSGDPGGGACVAVTAFEPGGRRFADLDVGDLLRLANDRLVDLGEMPIERMRTSQQRCVVIVAENGASLTCSLDAPIATPAGYCDAAELPPGQLIATLVDGAAAWSRVDRVEPCGVRAVRPLYVGNRAFWAGDSARACILHHNVKVTP